MIRKAFRMSVNAGQQEEYARRHEAIWQELSDTLIAHGVQTYSIFLDPMSGDLFAYAEIADEARWRAISETDVCRRWWRHMRDVMPSNPDDSPISRPLAEIFRLTNGAQ